MQQPPSKRIKRSHNKHDTTLQQQVLAAVKDELKRLSYVTAPTLGHLGFIAAHQPEYRVLHRHLVVSYKDDGRVLVRYVKKY